MKLQHFTSCESLTLEQILTLIQRGCELKEKTMDPIDQLVVNCFFENSTRTQTSFEIAERKVGMTVIPFNPATSSLSKGETFFDTMLAFDAMGIDIAVIRSNERGFFESIIESPFLNLSIINGGDGEGEHPSQCLLDMMTIYEEFGGFAGLKVVIAGDIKHSRVAHSNAKLLSRLGAHVSFAGPEIFMEDGYEPVVSLHDCIDSVDVVMLLRVQNERHPDTSVQDYYERYGLTVELARKLKKKAIIMHPAPVNRGVEIASALVVSDHARIVNQMHNGVYARMAILEAVSKGRTR